MRFLMICLFALCGSSALFSQNVPDPVKWSVEVSEDKIISKAEIDDGWVIYSQATPEGGPIATSFSYSPSISTDGETIEVEKPIKNFDELFEMDVLKFKHEATFLQKYNPTEEKAGEITIRYMSCNSKSCLPPKSVTFEVNL